MDTLESLNHSVWECKHHVVFIRKCRRKVLYSHLRRHLGEDQVQKAVHLTRNPAIDAAGDRRRRSWCNGKGSTKVHPGEHQQRNASCEPHRPEPPTVLLVGFVHQHDCRGRHRRDKEGKKRLACIPIQTTRVCTVSDEPRGSICRTLALSRARKR